MAAEVISDLRAMEIDSHAVEVADYQASLYADHYQESDVQAHSSRLWLWFYDHVLGQYHGLGIGVAPLSDDELSPVRGVPGLRGLENEIRAEI